MKATSWPGWPEEDYPAAYLSTTDRNMDMLGALSERGAGADSSTESQPLFFGAMVDSKPHITNILIADDHQMLRADLRSLLDSEPDLTVVGEAADGWQALSLATWLQPDVVVTDYSMPGANGLEVAQDLKQRLPDTRVLILTVYDDPGLLQEAIQAGADGYVVKRAAPAELVDAVRAVARGQRYIHPTMQQAARDLLEHARVGMPGLDVLGKQEIEILRLLAKGYTVRQIAFKLELSEAAVSAFRASLCDKLGMHGRAELTQYAKEQGLLGS